jgi:cell division ATPase FtsA
MTIDEYKKTLVTVVENMEREHGCEVRSVTIEANTYIIDSVQKSFNIEIEM